MFDELSMLNAMLRAVGIAPVASSDSTHPTFLEAKEVLQRADIRMQTPGLWFNTASRELHPNTLGEIVLPAGTLHADAVDAKWRTLVVNTGRMFDIATSSFVIGEPVTLTLIRLVDFVELPPEAALALEANAVFRFYSEKGGGEPRLSDYRRAAAQATAELAAANLRNLDLNALESPSMQAFYRGSRAGYPLGR